MQDAANSADRQLRNGPSNFGSRVRCECSVETDMRKDGETCAAVVSDSAPDGESIENHPYGTIVWCDS